MKEGWTQKMITEVAWFQEGPGVRNTQYTDSGVKLLNVANLVDGKVDLSTSKRYISENEAYGKYRHFLVDDGDFIVASSGIQVEYIDKKMGFINKSHLPLCMNTSTIRFKPIDSKVLNMRFFMYYLKSHDFKNQLARQITGIAQLNYGPSHLKRMYIPMTGITEQQRIVAELDLLTGIIDKQKAQLKELDTLAQSIFYDMFGNPESNEKGWKKYLLGEVCGFVNGFAFKSDFFKKNGLPVLRISNIQNDTIEEEDMVYFSPSDYKEDLRKYEVNNGDIVIAMSGATTGKLGVHRGAASYYLNQRVGKFDIKDKSKINSTFLFFFLKTISATILNDSMGVAQPNISSKQIQGYYIPLPPIEIQEFFAQKIQSIESQKASINQSLAETQKLFDYTMDKYFG